MFYDVFNGDADGICALHQLRLDEPCPSATLITGVKRDICLLNKISHLNNAQVTVLDISLASNQKGLIALLNQDCRVLYIDHHFSDTIPDSSALTAHIDPDPEICTSLIVDRLLEGRYRPWAIIGAFGDNLHAAARKTAAALSLTDKQIDILRELGELINYNGYGATLDDLHIPPQNLYKAIAPYSDPFEFYNHAPQLEKLKTGFNEDMRNARNVSPRLASAAGQVFELPPEPWARRVAGVFSNEKAREKPALAHALLTENQDKTYRISVRAPLTRKTGADKLCLAFPTGGGRAAAAGINALPPEMLQDFLQSFEQVFTS
jgi:hypothetical protein